MGQKEFKCIISPIKHDYSNLNQPKKFIYKVKNSPDSRKAIASLSKSSSKAKKLQDGNVEVSYVCKPNLGVSSTKASMKKSRKASRQLNGAYQINSIMSGFSQGMKKQTTGYFGTRNNSKIHVLGMSLIKLLRYTHGLNFKI